METDQGKEGKGVMKPTPASYPWQYTRRIPSVETRSPMSWLSLKHFSGWFYKKDKDIKILHSIQVSWRKPTGNQALARLRGELRSTLDKEESMLTKLGIPGFMNIAFSNAVRGSHSRKRVWLSCTGEETLLLGGSCCDCAGGCAHTQPSLAGCCLRTHYRT